MGFIFQHVYLLKNLCLLDNVVLPAYLAGLAPREELNERALALMERTGVADLADRDVSEASGGQLQRIGICRALINQPTILLGDEPTGALDSTAAAEIMDILGELNAEGTTIMLVTHDAKVAARTDRVLYMVDGRIVGDRHQGRYDRHAAEGADARGPARRLDRSAGRVGGDGDEHAPGTGRRPRRGRVVAGPDAASPRPGDRRLAPRRDPGDGAAVPRDRPDLHRRRRDGLRHVDLPDRRRRRSRRSSRCEPSASRW
jgi:energy-coupling factor transporter ATP-binding protein EcfA2